MFPFLMWYLLTTLAGAVTFPLVYALLPALPGRGYAFARAAGLLVWGYLFWMFAYLGIARNNTGGMLFALLVVAGLSGLAVYRAGYRDFADWLKTHRGLIMGVEVLFLATFVFWTVIRAGNPEIAGTEKPMEIAFLNSIMRSPSFPPSDPWLSGYAISYYYFGYIIMAMLTMMTGTAMGVAFNLGSALIFALGCAGAFGVVYNLMATRYPDETRKNVTAGLLGPFFVLLSGNAEGLFEVMHARWLFWRTGADGEPVSAFWSWLNVKDLVNPPAGDPSWLPQRYLWWWRGSRVINDLSFTGGQQEVIDEFPFFSFLLADLHPHVLAIPFVLLAIALAYNLYRGGFAGKTRIAGFELPVKPVFILAGGLSLGGLAFLNTWDFPIYTALMAGALVAARAEQDGWTPARLGEFLGTGLVLGITGVVLYFPFYIGFSSQAGGILPNVINPTRGAHLWIFFGTLLVPLLLYFLHLYLRDGENVQLGRGIVLALSFTLLLWIFSWMVVGLVALVPDAAETALSALGAPDGRALIQLAFARRFAGIGGLLTLVAVLGTAVAFLLKHTEGDAAVVGRPEGSMVFTLLMVIVGALLVIAPEFVYLRDLFGTRMNTIFKFYYQAWILWGLAAAYGAGVLLRDRGGAPAGLVYAGVFLSLAVGLIYPTFSLYTKTGGFDPFNGWRLDGVILSQEERQAVAWLQTQPTGTLVEAVGGSYSSGGRISAHTGFPAVLGWVFHQGQWRGGYEEVGSREGDIETIYRSASWEDTERLLRTYGVDYIVVGSLERSTYPVNEAKFRRNLPVLFENGSVTIYGYGFGQP